MAPMTKRRKKQEKQPPTSLTKQAFLLLCSFCSLSTDPLTLKGKPSFSCFTRPTQNQRKLPPLLPYRLPFFKQKLKQKALSSLLFLPSFLLPPKDQPFAPLVQRPFIGQMEREPSGSNWASRQRRSVHGRLEAYGLLEVEGKLEHAEKTICWQ